jgi:hypothetical protein
MAAASADTAADTHAGANRHRDPDGDPAADTHAHGDANGHADADTTACAATGLDGHHAHPRHGILDDYILRR